MSPISQGALMNGYRTAAWVICSWFASTSWAAVSGTVVDRTGKPIGGADVALCYARSASVAGNHLIGKTSAAPDGSFAFSDDLVWETDIPQTTFGPRFTLIAREAKAGLGYTNLQPNDSTSGVKVTIAERVVETTSVTNTDGKPLAGVRLWVCQAFPQRSGGVHQMLFMSTDIGFGASTNDSGRAELVVPSGTICYIAASKDGYARTVGQTQIVLTQSATVKGTITSQDGKPAAGAELTLISTRAMGLGDVFATADARGQYEIKDAPAEGYRIELLGQRVDGPAENILTATDESRKDMAVGEPFRPKPGEIVTQNLTLSKGLEISGKVIDFETDRPLPGMTISFYNRRTNSGTTITANAEGAFRTSVAPGDNVVLRVQGAPSTDLLVDDLQTGPGGTFYAQDVRLDRKDITLKVKLRKLAPLAGKVVDGDGKPLAGISVLVDPRLTPVTTGANGAFFLARAPTDRAGVVMADSPTHFGRTPFKAGQSEITITASAFQQRDCIAINDDGAPVPNLAISYFPAAFGLIPWGTPAGTATTDAQGRCRLKLVPGLDYRFNWAAGGDAPSALSRGTAIRRVSGAATEPITVAIPQYRRSLSLVFQDSAGSRLPDVRVELMAPGMVEESEGVRVRLLRSDKEGKFQINHLAAGLLRFNAYASKGNFRQTKFTVPTDAGESKCILRTHNEPAEHTVRVVDSDGKPVPSATVTVITTIQNSTDQEDQVADEGGVVTIRATAPRAQMAVFCDDADRGWGAAQLSPDDGAVILSLHLPDTPLQMQFVDMQKNPVPNVRVRISWLMSPLTEGGQGTRQQMPAFLNDELLTFYGLLQTTDANGQVTFPRVDAALQGGVTIQSPEYGRQDKPLPASGGGTPIELFRLPSLTGRLTIKGPDAADVKGMHLMLRSERLEQSVIVLPDGRFAVEQMQPGDYTVYIRRGSSQTFKYRSLSLTKLTLVPGEQRVLDLTAEPGIAIRGKIIGMVNGRAPRIIVNNDPTAPNLADVKSDGSFELWVAEPGEYRLMYETQGNGYLAWQDIVHVKDRNPVEGIEIKLP